MKKDGVFYAIIRRFFAESVRSFFMQSTGNKKDEGLHV